MYSLAITDKLTKCFCSLLTAKQAWQTFNLIGQQTHKQKSINYTRNGYGLHDILIVVILCNKNKQSFHVTAFMLQLLALPTKHYKQNLIECDTLTNLDHVLYNENKKSTAFTLFIQFIECVVSQSQTGTRYYYLLSCKKENGIIVYTILRLLLLYHLSLQHRQECLRKCWSRHFVALQ